MKQKYVHDSNAIQNAQISTNWSVRVSKRFEDWLTVHITIWKKYCICIWTQCTALLFVVVELAMEIWFIEKNHD